MADRELQGTLTTTDDIELGWRAWLPGDRIRSILLIAHGLFEHSARYRTLGDYFRSLGHGCYAIDFRGHGISNGRRVHVRGFDEYGRDLDAAMRLVVESHPGVPVFVLGHSMGGVVAIRFALDRGHELHGLILSSPGLAAHPDSRPPAWLAAAGRVLSKMAPSFLVDSGLDAGFVSRDPEVVAAYRADRLIGNRVSARWFTAFGDAQADCRARAGQLSVPILLMQAGADRLVDPAAAERWADRVPAGSIVYRVWPQCFHELFNEPERLEVFAAVEEWLDQHLGS